MGRCPISPVRKKYVVMRIAEFVRITVFGGVVATAFAGSAGVALAFDEKMFDESGSVKAKSNPWAVFQFGYSAYKSGHKDQAAEAYRYAAENGQIGATWKLARMYASGDGVSRDDFEAFKFFSEIAEQDVEPGSPDESYVSDALVALGGYLKTGIPGSPVEAQCHRGAGILHARRRQLPQSKRPVRDGQNVPEGRGRRESQRQAGGSLVPAGS